MTTQFKTSATTVCTICGKPLSDPISIQLGIGPVCRIMKKTGELCDKTQNLFASRSEYDYGLEGAVLWIEDLGGMKSVTNDIENVLIDIITIHGLRMLKGKKIMYKDSMSIWDGVKADITEEFQRGLLKPVIKSVSFFSLNEVSKSLAKIKLLQS